jgi:hypothetical protein
MPHVDPAKLKIFMDRPADIRKKLGLPQWWYNMVAFACREAKTMSSQSRM